MIEVNVIGIHGEQREPNIVGGQDCTAKRVAKNISHLEVFKYSSRPSFFNRHHRHPCIVRLGIRLFFRAATRQSSLGQNLIHSKLHPFAGLKPELRSLPFSHFPSSPEEEVRAAGQPRCPPNSSALAPSIADVPQTLA